MKGVACIAAPSDVVPQVNVVERKVSLVEDRAAGPQARPAVVGVAAVGDAAFNVKFSSVRVPVGMPP